jgi:hypothetical protein
MRGRFVLGVYASPATKNLRPALGEYRRGIPDVDAQTPRPIWLIVRST